MNDLKKYLAIAGAGAIGAFGIVLLGKTLGCRHHAGICEKTGKGLDEKLKESLEALDQAATRVQGVIEHFKSRKS